MTLGRSRSWTSATAALVVFLVVGGVAVWNKIASSSSEPTGGPTVALRPAATLRPTTVPPAGVGEHHGRLATPSAAPAGHGGFAFEITQSGGSTPVAWDPCRPIHYVTDGVAPAPLRGVVASALAEVSRLTGLRFVDDGATTETARSNRPAYQPERYGRRWAPVLVAWTSARDVPQLRGAAIGLGGGTALGFPGHPRSYVSGIVYLDEAQFLDDLARPEHPRHTRAMLRAVVLHEVGHLLGLAHVGDPHSVMYPEASLQVTDYSAGDRRGLHALALGRCAPEL